ncbi:MAG: CDP-alcohol phosphatidyltransferase family protein [Candidatus Omnitrophica bacterium]|nr:CDP-alcohol phosphatidyltransferase family protein [Candidatus Omnitrophota bacterium]
MFSVNRALSCRLTGLLSLTPLKPNHITFLGMLSGLTGAMFIAKGSPSSLLIGALCFHIAFILDNCDGELARRKSLVSELGKKLDLISDFVVDTCLWVGLGIGTVVLTGDSKWLALSFLCSAASAVNEWIVIRERQTGCCGSIHSEKKSVYKNPSVFRLVLDMICHNGDAVFLIWIMAMIGSHTLFLICGTVYIFTLISLRLALNRKSLFS